MEKEDQFDKDVHLIPLLTLRKEGGVNLTHFKCAFFALIFACTSQVANAQALTNSQKNAVRSASNYLSIMPFSKEGLIEQLSSVAGDGYDRNDAEIAVNNLIVDWNEQAAKAGENYLDMMGFSCKGLIEQLSSRAGDKYTKSQAKYGAEKAGACD